MRIARSLSLAQKSSLMPLLLIAAFLLPACGGESEEVLELIDPEVADVVDGVPRRSVDYSRMGLNSFVNDGRFGSIRNQFLEVRDTLGLSFVRVLFGWDDLVQPSPGSPINFSFYDDIAASIPPGVDALVVLTGVPSWMSDPAQWDAGNPRTTFVEQWVRKVVTRYADNPRIIGWQIWNEPNTDGDPHNILLEMSSSADNYVQMLRQAHSLAKQIAPGKLVVNAATTAINQNYPDTINYNRAMRDAGARDVTDVWAIHYYGEQFENVVRDNGVEDFLEGLGEEVWITESGIQGLTKQLEYAETVWPFLREEIPQINRIYYYQHTEAVPAEQSYGLSNLERVSDLFIALRDSMR